MVRLYKAIIAYKAKFFVIFFFGFVRKIRKKVMYKNQVYKRYIHIYFYRLKSVRNILSYIAAPEQLPDAIVKYTVSFI